MRHQVRVLGTVLGWAAVVVFYVAITLLFLLETLAHGCPNPTTTTTGGPTTSTSTSTTTTVTTSSTTTSSHTTTTSTTGTTTTSTTGTTSTTTTVTTTSTTTSSHTTTTTTTTSTTTGTGTTTTTLSGSVGVPHFAVDARLDPYGSGIEIFKNATASDKTFIGANWPRVLVSMPYFGSSNSNFASQWYPNGWVYKDGSVGTPVMKDAGGTTLCIKFPLNCNPCGQQMGDVGDPTYRTNWIAAMTTLLNDGANKGLLMDDMNDDMSRIGDCNSTAACDNVGPAHCPKDPRTGLTMTLEDYRRYLAEFAEAVKAAFPGKEIVHNPVFFLGMPDSDPFIARRVAASTVQSMERAVLGSVASGPNSVANYLLYIDQCHARSAAAWASPNNHATNTAALREYALAAYFLTNGGKDYVGSQPEGGTVTDWWAGWGVNLGTTATPRFKRSDGVWERDFANGKVFLNEPGGVTRTISLGSTFHRIDGSTTSSITLNASEGAVVFP